MGVEAAHTTSTNNAEFNGLLFVFVHCVVFCGEREIEREGGKKEKKKLWRSLKKGICQEES